jgi:hypothetical protein
MANKKISELSAITVIDDTDVLAIVDGSALQTKKISVTQVKALAPVQSVNGKTGDVTLVKGDVGLGNVDNTADADKPVSTDTQTALNAKQDTLVTGTNIKTINSTSLLGSGDIEITASPSGVGGAIQFSDGSAFASDAANLFWDDTNNRLGVGTNAPSATAHVKGSGSTSATTALLVQNSGGTNWLQVKDDGDITNGANGSTDLKFEISPVANKFFRLTRQSVNVDFYAGSSGNSAIEVSGGAPFNISAASANLNLSNGGVRVGSSYATTNASAQLEIVSTTKGFLPPKMTTTQKNAISSPASGLMVYDTTLNQMSYYNGTSWVNF